jgi:sugar lactone lactonase YvrE
MPTEEQIVVLGTRRYRVDTPWGVLPSGHEFGLISQLAVDREANVYVLQRTHPAIAVFEPSGKFLRYWEHVHIMDGHGIAITPDDRLIVVDRDAHHVLFFDTSGKLLQTLGERNRPHFGKPFNHPTDVSVAGDGEIYVADGYGNSMVHRFAADGTLKSSWGSPGDGPGQFTTPHAIWVDRLDRVLVVDRENNRVQIFDREGYYLSAWTDFFHPMDLYEDDRGMVYVTDQVPRLSMLAAEGRLAGRARPALNGAHGIWGDHRGNLFLAEMIPSRITKLTLIGSDDAHL